MNKIYTVFIGGTEVNDCLLTREEAIELRDYYLDHNYDDVVIMRIKGESNEND